MGRLPRGSARRATRRESAHRARTASPFPGRSGAREGQPKGPPAAARRHSPPTRLARQRMPGRNLARAGLAQQGGDSPLTRWFVNLWHSWYTGGVPAVRVMPHTVLSQHLPNGARTSTGRRDRLEPRRNPGAGPRLRTQVQILAAHGIAGRSCCRRWTCSFAGILIPRPARPRGYQGEPGDSRLTHVSLERL